MGSIRFDSRGGERSVLYDCAFVAIPVGIIGGRLYHVLTSPDGYFGADGHPLDALKIWQGGMGIWGAIALGTLAAHFIYRRHADLPPFALFADSLAPGLLIAQAIGRWGNWFNGELFGRPLNQSWAVTIPLEKRPIGYENFSTFHPTFLYESIWCLLAALLLIRWERNRILAPGSIFGGYIFLYCLGRIYFESLRIDAAHQILGLRINIWVASLLAFASLLWLLRRNRDYLAASSGGTSEP